MLIIQSVCTLLAVGNAYRVHCSTFLIYNTIVNENLKPLTCIITKHPQIVKAFSLFVSHVSKSTEESTYISTIPAWQRSI
jgi:hypothetical protein